MKILNILTTSIFYVKELIEGRNEDQPILIVNYTPTNQQVADFLTKAVPEPKFEICCKAIELINVTSKIGIGIAYTSSKR